MIMDLAAEYCDCAFQDPGASVANSPICGGSLLLFLAVLEQFINTRCDIAEPCKRIVGTREDELYDEYDFIVVGGGTAGSVVAGRLAETGGYRVLLLEAGGPEPVASRVPSFYRNYRNNPLVDWMYTTQPGDYCLDKNGNCVWARGKMLGGTSVLNGMMYHRGHPADFEDWADFGVTGWSWDENLYYYYMSEDNKQIGTLVSSEYHSTGGPMPIQRFRYHPEAAEDLLQALSETGYPIVSDLNDLSTPNGFTIPQSFTDDGQRFTTARAFLQPQYGPNLHVKLNALVSRVLFDGTQAYGVEYISGGETKTVRASKEVILSGGTLNTPKILMLSGIGPADTLQSLNITTIADLPVGQNLRNHVGIILYFVLEKEMNVQTLNWAVANEYLLGRSGPMTADGLTQVSGQVYSSLANQTRQQPDLQFFFNGYYAECSSTGAIGEEVVGYCPDSGMNISINAVALTPKSVGYLTINSTNPEDPPLFYPNYYDHEDDMKIVKDGIKNVHKIFHSTILQEKYGIKLDKTYNACSAYTDWSDKWMECIGRYYTDPQNHQVGTAAISTVVDETLQVYNVTGLRVIDAAVIPRLPTGNPQGQIMMVAEKGAAFIIDKWSTSTMTMTAHFRQ